MKAAFVVEIGRGAADVYDLLSNHENDVKWQSAVTSVSKLSAGPVRDGSRFRHTLTLPGAHMECEVEIVKTRAASLHVFAIAGGPFAFESTVQLTRSPSGTIVHTEIEGHAGGLARLAAVTLSRVRQREIELDLKRLKQMMESGAL